jgi:hypothetical protein
MTLLESEKVVEMHKRIDVQNKIKRTEISWSTLDMYFSPKVAGSQAKLRDITAERRASIRGAFKVAFCANSVK